MDSKNYTIGKGIFAFRPKSEAVFHDLGNVPAGTISFAVTNKDHYSTRTKAKTLDFSVNDQIDATLNLTVDDINIVNLTNWLLAEKEAVTQTSGTWGSGTELELTVVAMDAWHDLGKMVLSAIVAKDELGSTTFTEGVDYELNLDLGMIRPLSTGAIAKDDVIQITGTYGAGTSVLQLLAGKLTNVEGEVMFMSDPASGRKTSFRGNVQMSPSGDMGLISDDYATMQFTCKFTKGSANELFRMFTPAA